MLTKKTRLHLFNLILAAALVVSSQGSVLARSSPQEGEGITPPLFPELSWEGLGVVQKDLQLQGQALTLNGEAFQAFASFPDKNPESIFEYYSSENLETLGWVFVGGVDIELAYKNEAGSYLTVKIEQCSSDGVEYCLTVWQGEVTESGVAVQVIPFVKSSPANGSTISMPTTTYMLLRWTDAQIASTDRYQYCIDESNNNQCNTGWKTRNSLYSGGPGDFTLLPGHTYYWQVRTRDANTYANSGNWWSFTIKQYSFNKLTPSNGAVIRPPDTTYRLLQWTDAGPDLYEYCIDETNNNACDTSWIVRDSLYSGGPGDFTVVKNRTYYWQVRVKDYNSTANNGTWWSFTVQDFPLVYSITRYDPAASTTSAATVKYMVIFTQDVSGVDVSDFKLTTKGVSGASILSVENFDSNGIYIVKVKTGNGNGTVRLDLIDNDSIRNAASNRLGGPGAGNGNFKTGEVYTVKRPVTITSTAAQDGWVLESAENSGVGGTLNKGAVILVIGDDASNRQYRAILSFNTSSLPDNAVITAVTLKFKYAGQTGALPFSTHGNLLADIRKGPFSNNAALQLNDFKAAPSKSKALSFTDSRVDNWYSLPLAADKYQYVNRAGITQFRLRFALDDNNDSGADFLKIFSGNASAANHPRLIIEYHLP